MPGTKQGEDDTHSVLHTISDLISDIFGTSADSTTSIHSSAVHFLPSQDSVINLLHSSAAEAVTGVTAIIQHVGLI